MPTLEHVTVLELQNLLQSLPPETRLSVKFEEPEATKNALKRQKGLDAMKKLRGSGNGKLLEALLAERECDKRS